MNIVYSLHFDTAAIR